MEKAKYYSVPVCILVSTLSLLTMFPQKSAGRDRLNVLLITIDTLRPDRLSCYSTEYVKTPNIDRLAEKGALFLRAFAHTPTTLPSHTNILLGTTPLYHGVHDNSNFIVREEFLTLSELLKAQGYATGAFVGAFPLDSRFGLTQGFDVYDDNYGGRSEQEFTYVERKAEVVVEQALEWLKDQRQPWFLWVHCFDPHQRYDPPEPFISKYKDHPYNGEVAYVDFSLGKLFDYLDQNGLYDKTLIIFTGDHGESLGQHGETTHGYFAYNATLWVPLIVSYPHMKQGRIDQEVCHIDIFPTVCDVLDIEKPSFLQGFSLVPAIERKSLPKRMIYFESLYPYYSRGWAPLKGFIEEKEKYLDSPILELYDLDRDFDELVNLAPSADMKKYTDRLSKLAKEQSLADNPEQQKKIDHQALEKLKTLGYISGPRVTRKENFTEKDDLKVLLPFQMKLQRAMGAYHKGNTPEGEELLKSIVAERKDFDLAFTYLATLYKEQGKLREAVEVLRQGREHNPKSYKIITTFGIFLTEVGEFDAAIGILEEGLALVDYDPELWNYLGVAYWRKGDLEKAQKAYEQALKLDENYPIVINNLGSLYLSRAMKNKTSEDLKRAIENFQKAIALDPTYASAYNGLGSACAQTGNLDTAIEAWEKAVALDPNLSFAVYNLGLAHFARGEKEKALSYFTRYKREYYARLPQKEKQKLDSLIQQCQQKIP